MRGSSHFGRHTPPSPPNIFPLVRRRPKVLPFFSCDFLGPLSAMASGRHTFKTPNSPRDSFAAPAIFFADKSQIPLRADFNSFIVIAAKHRVFEGIPFTPRPGPLPSGSLAKKRPFMAPPLRFQPPPKSVTPTRCTRCIVRAPLSSSFFPSMCGGANSLPGPLCSPDRPLLMTI